MTNHAFVNSDATKFDSNCATCGGKHRDSVHKLEETFNFENVTMYRTGMFGVSRTDCKKLTVKTGQKYAQYNEAVRIEYLEKGKRTPRYFMLDYAPWLRVVATKDAINPDSPMQSNGDGSSSSRYASCDPRYQTDFEDKLEASDVNHLISIGIGDRKGAHLDRCKAMDSRR